MPHLPSGLDMTAYFADVLRDYAIMSRSEDTRNLALDYVSQLVQELNGTEKAVPAMRVLGHLIAPTSPHSVSSTLVALASPMHNLVWAHWYRSHCILDKLSSSFCVALFANCGFIFSPYSDGLHW